MDALSDGDLGGARRWFTRMKECPDEGLKTYLMMHAADGDETSAVLLAYLAGDYDWSDPDGFELVPVGDSAGEERVSRGILAMQMGDQEEALSLWQAAMNDGSAEAANLLGVHLRTVGDLEGARQCWTIAAEAGVPGAMRDLGLDAFERGDLGTARKWWLRGVENGDDGSMCNMGELALQLGDSNAADHWWKRAAAGGNTTAMNTLAFRAFSGGFHASARSWFEQAAALGDASAVYNVGMLACLDENDEDAEYWLWLATTHGDPDAWFMLNWIWAATGANRQNGAPDVPRPTAIWREAPDEGREVGIALLTRLLAAIDGENIADVVDVLVDAGLTQEQVGALATQLLLILSRWERLQSVVEYQASELPPLSHRAFATALECARTARVREFESQYVATGGGDEGITILLASLLQCLKVAAINDPEPLAMLETLRSPIERDLARQATPDS